MVGRVVRYTAPGRINLIGEHTDYNLGFALPIALPEHTVVTYVADEGDTITVRSDRESGQVQIPLHTSPGEVTGWAAYVAGVVWALRSKGHRVRGGRMSVTGGVAMGSGLASSAALECATLGAIAADLDLSRMEQANIAQRAENEYVGAPTGLLDQLASLFGEDRRALLIDFRDVTVQPVPFDPQASGVVLLLIDSRATHQHAGGEYAARRNSCERAAAELAVSSLRDVQDLGPSVLRAVRDPVAARRARHVLTENRRVLDTVDALHGRDFSAVGRLLTASHESMRDDFEITTEHIDLIADVAVRTGALGARMTGGGFGGCVITLVDIARVDSVADAVRDAMQQNGFASPSIVSTRAGGGACSRPDQLRA
jgi:galactokinase